MKSRRRRNIESIDDQDPETKLKTLRKRYGAGLAPDWDGECTLGELLSKTNFESLTQYVKHHGRRPEKQAITEPEANQNQPT